MSDGNSQAWKSICEFNWGAFDASTGLKVALGLLGVTLLTGITGQPWLATGLVMLFAWMTDVSGKLSERLLGIGLFAVGSLVVTLVSELIQDDPLGNALFLGAVGFLASYAIKHGIRPYLVGYSVICWAIYGPAMVLATGLANTLLAVVVGSASVAVLLALFSQRETAPVEEENGANALELPDGYPLVYAITVGITLTLATYLGWAYLGTDPTLIVGAAFFVIGPDPRASWAAGVTRIVGVIAGGYFGYWCAITLGPGVPLDIIVLGACFMSFAAASVHSGALMFFLLVMIGAGWGEITSDDLNIFAIERFGGETLGSVLAMIAVLSLQFWQGRQSSGGSSNPA